MPPNRFQTSAFASRAVYAPGGSFGPNWEVQHQLMIIYAGSVAVDLDGEPALQIPPLHIGLVPGGHQMTLRFDADRESWQGYIHRYFAPEELGGVPSKPAVLPLSDEMSHLADALMGLSNRGMAQDHPILLELTRQAFLLFAEDARGERGLKAALHPALFKARRQIWDHLAAPLSLKELAAVAGVTPEHLVRLFKQHLGVTPMEYLWRERVRIAVQVIRKSGLSLAEIAERTGFKQVYHFSRRIKKATGLTPMALRRQAWKGAGPGSFPIPQEQKSGKT